MSGINAARARKLLRATALEQLFVEELGWDRHKATRLIERNGTTYTFSALAEKRGVVAFLCASAAGQLPSYQDRIALERELRKLVHEHVIIFVDGAGAFQIWQWVRREAGKPQATREHHFHVSQSGDSLIAKLDQLLFTLAEEDSITISEVTQRARQAFDIESVTRQFYDRFQDEHKAFLSFIRGFTDQGDAEWYASLMLNRLMFIYFVQKRGFIDNDRDYLQNRLRRVREVRGEDKFFSFYRFFLLRLFHDGLAMPVSDREKDLADLLGKVPYLNGGLFEPHRLERLGSHVEIDDAAFVRLFGFFDSYSWHLDDRPLKSDNEINPDVLGYIFEKYINQKEMGAYYTKEDVTGYIAGNAIGIALLHRLGGSGAIDRARELVTLAPERYLPPSLFAASLPGEGQADERERSRRRHEAVRQMRRPPLEWNDAIRHNVDLSVFLEDVLQEAYPDELWEFWVTLNGLKVLDPTCGSGAFLFAALRILQPLFEGTTARMEALLGTTNLTTEQRSSFESVITEIRRHANPTYFTLKRILLNNLFGVDLMEEAVEICKLRLFLQAASTLQTPTDLEPLPDLDFNVKCGNTIIGFSSRGELAAAMGEVLDLHGDHAGVLSALDKLDSAHARFRQAQGLAVHNRPATNKDSLEESLDSVRAELDRYLLKRVGGVTPRSEEAWIKQNHPFHWFAEFHEIMESGGFDVIIGNPPYSEVPQTLSRDYLVKQYSTALSRWSRDEDVYTFVVERSLELLAEGGVFGMVLPLSLSFSTKRSYGLLREQIAKADGSWWFSHFDRIPSSLFGNDVRTRNTVAIHVSHPSEYEGGSIVGVTELLRWTHEQRDYLFDTLHYAVIDEVPVLGIPKLGSQRQAKAYEALTHSKHSLGVDLTDSVSFSSLASSAPVFPSKSVFIGGTAYNWFPVWREIPETTDAAGNPSLPARTACYRFKSEEEADVVFALLGSSLGYWWWAVASDGFNLKKWLLDRFPISLRDLTKEARKELASAGAALRRELRKHYVYKDNRGRVGNWYLPACSAQMHAIDAVLAKQVDVLDEEFFADIQAFNSRFSTAQTVDPGADHAS
ncbi:Eco57I restriction-modification methylase domain-containing protein [Arthrobacter sp. NPDC093139]|uniref:Eco57I restriction-modification methylase domain-containing protein n=1 Tax=Arthrobacter sp. NPDC093139 TaxID=3363945 RepID=UPI0038220B18